MLFVTPYFHVHQPYRIKRYRIFDVGKDTLYWNDAGESDLNNKKVLAKVAAKSYLPANSVLLGLLNKHSEFRFAFSFSGVLLDQLQSDFPDVLDSFKRIVATGKVEILSDTYYHSLAFFHSPREFEKQVVLHREKMREIFGATPRVLRNTELSYNNDLALWAERAGFIGILAEGWDPVLGWRSPNFPYRPAGCKKIKVLLKNYRLSDDIAFRFGERSWKEWPLSAPRFAGWVNAAHGNGVTVNLFMDYETFGEHQWEDTGIFAFLRALPGELLKHPETTFGTPSEVITKHDTVGELDVPHTLTWADTERDLSAWTGNEMQQDALGKLYALEEKIKQSKDPYLLEDWRRLQTSDHFYYMCTKWFSDGDVHKYFNPYDSPYDAYLAFMNVLRDVELRVAEHESAPLWERIKRFFI